MWISSLSLRCFRNSFSLFLKIFFRGEMWRAIKQVLPGTKKSTVSSIFENGKWHTSKFMVIGGRNKLIQFNDTPLVSNNDQLENVTKFKYLVVIINQHLSCHHDHIEQLHSKIAKRLLVVLKRIKQLLLVYAKRIYVSTINSHSYSWICKYRMGWQK